MRQVFLVFTLAVLVFPVFAGGATVVKVDDWSLSEPLVGFGLSGGMLELSLMDRMTGGQIDEPATLLRALIYVNPGLMEQLAMETLKRANTQGILSYPGDVSSLTQSQLDQLNEVLRRLVYDELGPAMSAARQKVDHATLVSIGAKLDASARDIEVLHRSNLKLTNAWYQVDVFGANGSFSETTICVPDDGSCGSGGVFCPGQCVGGCDPPARNCTSVTVPIDPQQWQLGRLQEFGE